MPSNNYEIITSDHIRGLLEKTSWDNHQYIDDLLQLAHYIINPPQSIAPGYQMNSLINRYRDDYKKLLHEQEPGQLERQSAEAEKFMLHTLAIETATAVAEEVTKDRWLQAGGLP